MANSRKSQQPDLTDKFAAALMRFLPQRRPLKLCVGLSGGLDSVVLLHLLNKARVEPGLVVSALHVHHGLSPNADAWADFVVALTDELDVSCAIVRVEINPAGEGLEAAARNARYAAFAQSDADVLLLAHHANDQAETLLFNLLRGSGVSGLAAMPAVRALGDKLILRPLLDVGRNELVAYAQNHDLRWVEDESNASPAFSRNHLRHEILPMLAARYPAVVATLARTARHMGEADALLDEFGAQDLAYCLCEGAFDLSRAGCLSLGRMQHALRYWLRQSGIVLESRSWQALLAMLNARDDSMPALIWRERAVRRYRDRLYLTPAHCCAGPVVPLQPQALGVWAVPAWSGALSLSMDGVLSPYWLGQPWVLRPWSGSAQLRLRPGRHSRTLKHLCQEAGIPPWRREMTPLIFQGDRLMAVPGLGVAADFQVQDGDSGIRLDWRCDAA